MVTRAESAGATRRALLDAAAHLLVAGGPEAVTLRAVGAQAGVTRGAPYRHFSDKESLLIAVAAQAWEQVADTLHTLRTNPRLSPHERLRRSLLTLVDLARRKPHLYRLMFSAPAGDPTLALRAAGRSHDEFLPIVAEAVQGPNTREMAAILFSSTHGIADMEISGHLASDKWQTSGDELVRLLVSLI